MFDALQDASQALARAEVELRQAEATQAEASLQRSAIAERIAAKQAAISEARQIRVQRILTEQEAAQFNLDLMDLEDLQGLHLTANGPVMAAQAKVKAAQASVIQRRAYLDHVADELRLQALVASAAEQEQRLCETLQEVFDVARNSARSMGPRKTMLDLWKPTRALQNVVNLNRPPNGVL